MFDIILDWSVWADVVNASGMEVFFKHVAGIFPERQLFSVSTDWVHSPTYIAKLKGATGDVVVGWKGVHG